MITVSIRFLWSTLWLMNLILVSWTQPVNYQSMIICVLVPPFPIIHFLSSSFTPYHFHLSYNPLGRKADKWNEMERETVMTKRMQNLTSSSVGSYLRPPCLVSLLTRSVSSSRFVITSFFLPSPYETSGEEGRRSEWHEVREDTKGTEVKRKRTAGCTHVNDWKW